MDITKYIVWWEYNLAAPGYRIASISPVGGGKTVPDNHFANWRVVSATDELDAYKQVMEELTRRGK